MKNKTVLITGATGIMGCWVLGEALDRGYDPIVLMRDTDLDHARERLAAVLGLVQRSQCVDRVKIVRGDTREPDLGLTSDTVTNLRTSLGGMIHCAACTTFDPRRDGELWNTNVGGVANVLRFLQGTGIPLYHVSTAYVAGKRTGRALETELNINQEFNNTYERSKCESEQLVHLAIDKGSVQAAIFRPGILVGAGDGGRISQFLNFYQFLRFIDYAGNTKLKCNGRLRVKANPVSTKNLVPVDWSAKALWHIIEAEGPSSKTYHLTNPKPLTHGSLKNWVCQQLGVHEIVFVERLSGSLTPLEAAANASLRLYQGYMQSEPCFDRSNTDQALGGAFPFPKVDAELCVKLLQFARERQWKGIFGCNTKAARVKAAQQSDTRQIATG